jgi:hypothetical protein
MAKERAQVNTEVYLPVNGPDDSGCFQLGKFMSNDGET